MTSKDGLVDARLINFNDLRRDSNFASVNELNSNQRNFNNPGRSASQPDLANFT